MLGQVVWVCDCGADSEDPFEHKGTCSYFVNAGIADVLSSLLEEIDSQKRITKELVRAVGILNNGGFYNP
jgi:hypothetical protein